MSELIPKVFSMNDCDWWAGYTLRETIVAYCLDCELPEDEAVDGPYELTEGEMNKLKVYDEHDEVTRTFADQLSKEILDGKNFPCFFASTEF